MVAGTKEKHFFILMTFDPVYLLRQGGYVRDVMMAVRRAFESLTFPTYLMK